MLKIIFVKDFPDILYKNINIKTLFYFLLKVKIERFFLDKNF